LKRKRNQRQKRESESKKRVGILIKRKKRKERKKSKEVQVGSMISSLFVHPFAASLSSLASRNVLLKNLFFLPPSSSIPSRALFFSSLHLNEKVYTSASRSIQEMKEKL
jgi:hypothetical protein